MNLTRTIATRIFHSTGLYPTDMYEGKGDYQIISEPIKTPFLYVIRIKPLKVSAKEFTTDKLAKDLKLVTGLDQSEQVVIDVHKGFVCIQIPRPLEERGKKVYTSENVSFGSGLRVRLGLDILNEPVDYNFGDEMNTNLSFLGVPGCGKSISMRRAITALAYDNNPYDVKFLMIEVSKNGIDLEVFDDLAHLYHPVITNSEEAEKVLGLIKNEITKGSLPFKLIICIDEVAELIRQRPTITNTLLTLISQGRSQNIINLLATQITDKDTLGSQGKALFRQIHNTILGKVSNKQLSYVLGNQANLKAEALIGKGDLLLNSSDTTTRFVGAYTSPNDLENLTRNRLVRKLPVEYTNTNSIIKSIGAPIKEVPANIIAEGLISLQSQLDSKIQRPKPYYVMAANKAIKLGRNAETFKTRDQPHIAAIYRELWKKGYKLCQK